MKRLMAPGRPPRYGYFELIGAGNIGEGGRVLSPDSIRSQLGKVWGMVLFFARPIKHYPGKCFVAR